MTRTLITGATSGIGAEFARQLAVRGDSLVLVARDRERLGATAEKLRTRYGAEVEVLAADLSDRAQVDSVAERFTDQAAPISQLINNAGFGLHHQKTLRPSDESIHELDRALEVMLRTVIVLSGAAARSMVTRGQGTIVNVSSTAGFGTMGVYSAIKSAVTSYTESLASELKGTGVSATALCPGWVRTEFHERAGISTASIPAAAWVELETVVEQGIADSARGVIVSVPTNRWKAVALASRLLPRAAVRAVSAKLRSSR